MIYLHLFIIQNINNYLCFLHSWNRGHYPYPCGNHTIRLTTLDEIFQLMCTSSFYERTWPKAHVRFCNHLASVNIRRSYSKHKLFSKILSSETIDLFDYFIIKFAFWIGIVQNIAYSIIIIRRFDYAALFY